MIPDLTNTLLLVIKIFFLIGIGVYSLFALVIVRQEQLMANVLEEQFEPVLKLITAIHLAASIGVFILALMTL